MTFELGLNSTSIAQKKNAARKRLRGITCKESIGRLAYRSLVLNSLQITVQIPSSSTQQKPLPRPVILGFFVQIEITRRRGVRRTIVSRNPLKI